jgi:protein-L-isoaspartate(D-aspartate) O-methyltransferase
MARLSGQVTGIELDGNLLERARTNLERLAIDGVTLRQGDALAGPVEGAPFDAIAVTGSLPTPDALAGLQSQLAAGGRLFVVVGEAPVMEALLFTRVTERDFRRESLFETCLPALANAPRPVHFEF